MSKKVLFSVNLRSALDGTSNLKALLDNCRIDLYSGTVPTDPDAALSGATLLTHISKNDASVANDLVWDATASPGTLMKPSADTWCAPTTGGIVASGTPTFGVIYANSADNGSTSTSGHSTYYRVVFMVGPDNVNYFLQCGALTSGNPLSINSFALGYNGSF